MNLSAAVIQMVSGPDVDENLERAAALIADATSMGAELVVLPETFACFSTRLQKPLAQEALANANHGRVHQFLSAQAEQHNIWLVGGTVPEFSMERMSQENPFTTSIVYSPKGQRVASYHKVHLFDVDVADAQGSYRESDTYAAGSEVIATGIETADGSTTLGLSVCYDLRFPELYRLLALKGAAVVSVPAAFTKKTGDAHWQLLLRARAVENQCFMIGANQGGQHGPSRQTSGGSCIVSPWGDVLAEVDYGEGVAVAELDLSQCKDLQSRMPVFQHRRFFLKDE
ncbi:MAG: carbon-nitrogen hydrolase family protein [Cellvibrionaceae bacterium]